MLLSEILGKRVVVINTADELGCIIGAYVHKNTFARTHLILENNRHIKLEDVFSYGEIITVLEHEEESIPLDDYYKITSLQEVILVSGERLGKVKDMTLSGKKKDNVLVADKGSIKLKSLVSVSTNLIIANPTYRALKQRIKEPDTQILAISGTSIQNSNLSNETTFLPISPTPSYDFLIGKKVNSEVSDINRSFVLMAGTIITEKIISNAIRAGKLTDLVNKSK